MENLAKAMIAVQGELKAVPKDAKGYNYTYQTLDGILNMARPILTKHGLVLIQQVTKAEHLGHAALRTTLLHESGEQISDVAEIPYPAGKMSEAQQAGSAITYLRRYSVSALLGIVSEADDDAAGGQPNGQASKPTPQKPAKKAVRKSESAIADLRATIEGAGDTVTFGFVLDRAAMTGEYNHQNHALGAARKWDGWPEGKADTVQFSTKLKTKTALSLFDWLMAREHETK